MIDPEALERTARERLARLGWWGRLDGVEGADAATASQWLKLAASTLSPEHTQAKAFGEARAAVAAWQSATDLRSRATALLSHPAIRALAGDPETLEYLVAHPAEAMKLLVRHSLDHRGEYRDGSPLAQALTLASEASVFHEEHEISSSEPAGASPEASAGRGEQTPGGRARGPAPGRLAPHDPNDEWASAISAYEASHPEEESE